MIVDLFPTPVMLINLEDQLRPEDVEFIRHWGDNPEFLDRQGNPATAHDEDYYFLDKILPDPALKQLLEGYANKFLHEVWKENTNRLGMTTSWVNSLIPGNTGIYRHMHRNSILSGVLYINIDEGHQGLTFHDPKPRHIVGYTTKENRYTQDSITITPKLFDLIMFPGTLDHSVTEHKASTSRISLAFNTFYVGDIYTNNKYGSFGAMTIAKATVSGQVS